MTFNRPPINTDLIERTEGLRGKGFKLPRTLSQLRRDVAKSGSQKWLIEGIWRHGDYGILSAAPKAQKTYNAVDLGVAVATGTPWLGFVKTEVQGTVMMFLGEGGDAEVLRRVEGALGERDITDPDEISGLPLVIESRVPNLTRKEAVEWLEVSVQVYKPVLVILDPLYLAADSADSASVYAMGGLLTKAQHACQDVGASLFVNHHDKKGTKEKGMSRLAGAGVTEWARVILGANINSQHTKPDQNGVMVSTTDITLASLTGNGTEIRFTRELSRPGKDADSPIVIKTTPAGSKSAGEGTVTVDIPVAKDLPKRLPTLLDLIGSETMHQAALRKRAVEKKVGSDSTVRNLIRQAQMDGLIEPRVGVVDNRAAKILEITPLGAAWMAAPVLDRAKFEEFRENHSSS